MLIISIELFLFIPISSPQQMACGCPYSKIIKNQIKNTVIHAVLLPHGGFSWWTLQQQQTSFNDHELIWRSQLCWKGQTKTCMYFFWSDQLKLCMVVSCASKILHFRALWVFKGRAFVVYLKGEHSCISNAHPALMLAFTIELITLNITDGIEFWSQWVGMLKFALFVSSWMHVLLRENWKSANTKLLCYGKSKWTEAAAWNILDFKPTNHFWSNIVPTNFSQLQTTKLLSAKASPHS